MNPEDLDRYITGNWGEDQYPEHLEEVEQDWDEDDFQCDDGDDTSW